jgi:hypothetical protein
MTKFSCLLDQIKAPEVKAVLTILQTAKSKLIQVKHFIIKKAKQKPFIFISNGEYLT